MTRCSDRWSGDGVAIRSDVTGTKYGQTVHCRSVLFHPNTAEAAGIGAGAVAELLLSKKLRKPGVWAPEQAVTTQMFETAMRSRSIEIHQQLIPDSIEPIYKKIYAYD